ncbi:hypothetical protein PybrP1_004368 [[Pythium] brassicae (nom. inval.)]|nr:hypothetical protein PybrP1_004368 [[Pythium] brassicae (nom. inval.)]
MKVNTKPRGRGYNLKRQSSERGEQQTAPLGCIGSTACVSSSALALAAAVWRRDLALDINQQGLQNHHIRNLWLAAHNSILIKHSGVHTGDANQFQVFGQHNRSRNLQAAMRVCGDAGGLV